MSESGELEETPRLRRFDVTLGYCGRDFHGWQFQEGVRTVEGELRAALAQLSPEPIETVGASRTDRGVHAHGQRCRCELTTRLPADRLVRALQALTPPDLMVHAVHEVDASFHPRFDAQEKRYLYRVRSALAPTCFGDDLHWWVRQPLDVAAMRAASAPLIGRHDFEAFRNVSKDGPDDAVRTVRVIDWREHRDGWLTCQVIGDGFLYKMVRNLVGTLVEVGRGARGPEEIAEILASRDRRRAGATAPPQGLFLMNIRYSDERPLVADPEPWIPQ
ncbi:MAG: tRNA pseudouridine(38-40) synthase TruA [Planctomycetota bacterium]